MKSTRAVQRVGRVVFENSTEAVPCAIRTFSERSAVLVMNGWLGLPDQFTLYVDPDQLKISCKVGRRQGSMVTVLFQEIEEGVRFRG